MSAPLLVSIQVGLPAVRGLPGSDDPMDQTWTSGIVKAPVDGPVWLGRTNLAGDGQADLVNHGGLDKAVLSYAAAHYPGWRRELERPDLPHGAFGENFTVDGLTEDAVCIGDTYTLGDDVVRARLGLDQGSALLTVDGVDRILGTAFVAIHTHRNNTLEAQQRKHHRITTVAKQRMMGLLSGPDPGPVEF